MSHKNITIPLTVEYTERPGSLQPVVRNLLPDPDTASYRFIENPELGLNGPFDPWELRQDFLAWPVDDWQGFVAMAGCLGPFRISKASFERWQQLLRAALIRPASEWKVLEAESGVSDPHFRLSEPMRLTFAWDGEVPTARIRTVKSLVAILATIQIDKLQGAEFHVCARHDCKSAPFRVQARHKIFCSSDCAHLVAVRNSRERAAKAKATKKTPNRKQRGGKAK